MPNRQHTAFYQSLEFVNTSYHVADNTSKIWDYFYTSKKGFRFWTFPPKASIGRAPLFFCFSACCQACPV
jgi:hypothetical protein